MIIDIGIIQPNSKEMSDDACPVVNENDACPYWEHTGDESLILMRECWYCKYSDFRKDLSVHQTRSLCHCTANQSNIK